MVHAPQLFSLRDIREHYLRISKPRNSQKTELYIWEGLAFSALPAA
jgi:hypothetical protein